MTASDFASGGSELICIAGLIFSPLQLNRSGISDPSENEGLVIIKLFIQKNLYGKKIRLYLFRNTAFLNVILPVLPRFHKKINKVGRNRRSLIYIVLKQCQIFSPEKMAFCRINSRKSFLLFKKIHCGWRSLFTPLYFFYPDQRY